METAICIALAGDIGAELTGERPSGFIGDTAHGQAATLAAHELVGLTTADAMHLEALETTAEPFESDDDAAWRLAHAYAEQEAIHLVTYLRASTRSLLYRRHRLVEGLAVLLCERTVLPGRKAREFLKTL